MAHIERSAPAWSGTMRTGSRASHRSHTSGISRPVAGSYGNRTVPSGSAVHPRDHLVAQIGQVVAGSGRVEELAATERGPAVDPYHDAGWDLTRSDPAVGQLREGGAHRWPVPPHVELAGEPLDHVDGRVAPFGLLVVARRDVHPQRAAMWVAERVPAERLALQDVFVEPAGGLTRPGVHIELLSASGPPLPLPARRVPVTAEPRIVVRDHDEVHGAGPDLLVAPRAPVGAVTGHLAHGDALGMRPRRCAASGLSRRRRSGAFASGTMSSWHPAIMLRRRVSGELPRSRRVPASR